jgi:hypothetical protein
MYLLEQGRASEWHDPCAGTSGRLSLGRAHIWAGDRQVGIIISSSRISIITTIIATSTTLAPPAIVVNIPISFSR